VTGAAHCATSPVPDDELASLAVAWGRERLDRPWEDLEPAIALYLGHADASLLDALAWLACSGQPDAVAPFLRVSARMIERLSGYEPDGRGRENAHAERWLDACRRRLATPDVADWRKRLLRHRWAARGEHRITLAAAIRRRLTAKDLEQIARRPPR
jgi:hypothetical protein